MCAKPSDTLTSLLWCNTVNPGSLYLLVCQYPIKHKCAVVFSIRIVLGEKVIILFAFVLLLAMFGSPFVHSLPLCIWWWYQEHLLVLARWWHGRKIEEVLVNNENVRVQLGCNIGIYIFWSSLQSYTYCRIGRIGS